MTVLLSTLLLFGLSVFFFFAGYLVGIFLERRDEMDGKK